MIQAFYINKEQLKNIDFICPAGKEYNLHLNKGQHWELSKSRKLLYLVDDTDNNNFIKFIVSKTIFVLKKRN